MTTRRVLLVLIGAAALSVGLIATSQLGARDREEAPRRSGGDAQLAGRDPAAWDRARGSGRARHARRVRRPAVPVLRRVGDADLPRPRLRLRAHREAPDRLPRARVHRARLRHRAPDGARCGRENRLWDVVAGFYVRQGAENAWVTDDLVDDVAVEAGLDAGRLRDARDESWVSAELRAAQATADAAGVHGTPSFQLGRTGGALELVQLRSLGPEGMTPAIDTLLRR